MSPKALPIRPSSLRSTGFSVEAIVNIRASLFSKCQPARSLTYAVLTIVNGLDKRDPLSLDGHLDTQSFPSPRDILSATLFRKFTILYTSPKPYIHSAPNVHAVLKSL